MQQRNIAKLSICWLAVVALGLSHGLIYLGALALFSAKTWQSQTSPFLFGNSLLISDFDGDNRPDLAIGRVNGNNYNVEIQLSRHSETATFTLNNGTFGIGLFAYDVDRDNDKDLVITSALSSQPVAICLSDGQGHFELDHSTSNENLFNNGSGSLQHNGPATLSVMITNPVQLPFDCTSQTVLPARLLCGYCWLARAPDQYQGQVTYHSSSRAPPAVIC